MRNFFLILFIFAASLGLKAENYAECFCGWDLTVGVGYSDFHEAITATTTIGAPFDVTSVSDIDEGTGSVAVQGKTGLHMGFWNRWVLGAEFYAQYNNADIIRKFTDGAGNVFESQITLPVNLGVDIRFGYAYCPNQLLFVSIGPDWGQHKQQHTANRTADEVTKWIVAPRLVGGAEQRVCGKLILKEEFSFAWYQHFNVNLATGVSVEHDPRLSTFMFSAGYLF